jgi:hypothetical protein
VGPALSIPPGMAVTGRYPDSVPCKATSRLRDSRIYRSASRDRPSELDGRRRTYRGLASGGGSERVYRVELVELRSDRQIIITDVTPKPIEPGLSYESAEARWLSAKTDPHPSAQSM